MMDGFTEYSDSPKSNKKSNGHTSAARVLGTLSSAQIVAMDLPPVSYVVMQYIAEGLTILAGRPKIGKSWLALMLAIAVGEGGKAFGSIPCDQGDVLYLALEDNLRRIQRRLKQMLPHGAAPARLFIETECPRLDEGGTELIREWIERVSKPRLIVVDVFNMVRPRSSSTDTLYESDYRALAPLKKMADDYGVAVVILHHTRKMAADDPFDTVSGSTGLTGAADTVLVLTRDGQGTTVYGRGRDVEQIETALSFDPVTASWSILGAASEVRRSDERTIILDAMREEGAGMSPLAVAEATGMRRENVKVLMAKMAKQGELSKSGRGKYLITGVTPDYHDYRDYQDGGDGTNR